MWIRSTWKNGKRYLAKVTPTLRWTEATRWNGKCYHALISHVCLSLGHDLKKIRAQRTLDANHRISYLPKKKEAQRTQDASNRITFLYSIRHTNCRSLWAVSHLNTNCAECSLTCERESCTVPSCHPVLMSNWAETPVYMRVRVGKWAFYLFISYLPTIYLFLLILRTVGFLHIYVLLNVSCV